MQSITAIELQQGNFMQTTRWLEWAATSTLLISVMLTAVDIWPLNILFGLTANGLWIIVGLQWRKWSMVICSGTICSIYGFGLARYLMGF